MAKYEVMVWASVGGKTDTEIVSIESDTLPTQDVIDEVYKNHIANILDSGAYLMDEDEEWKNYTKKYLKS